MPTRLQIQKKARPFVFSKLQWFYYILNKHRITKIGNRVH